MSQAPSPLQMQQLPIQEPTDPARGRLATSGRSRRGIRLTVGMVGAAAMIAVLTACSSTPPSASTGGSVPTPTPTASCAHPGGGGFPGGGASGRPRPTGAPGAQGGGQGGNRPPGPRPTGAPGAGAGCFGANR